MLDGRLHEVTYSDAKAEAAKRARRRASSRKPAGGWAGFTDKYWLTALTPVDQSARAPRRLPATQEPGPRGPRTAGRWTSRRRRRDAGRRPAPPARWPRRALRRRQGGAPARRLCATGYGIPDFDKAVDFGWFYFLTKPFFYALRLARSQLVGNFGVAILIFTLLLKLAFFPLANKAYKSMSRMKILRAEDARRSGSGYKDDPAKAQAEMMALYRPRRSTRPRAACRS